MASASLSSSAFLPPFRQDHTTSINDFIEIFGFKHRVSCFHSSLTSPKGMIRWKHGQIFCLSSLKSPSKSKMKLNRQKNINKRMERTFSANTVIEALSHCIRDKQWLQALQVFQMLREQPFYEPKEKTYLKLLVLLGKCRQPHLSQQLFDAMVEERCMPSTRSYTALISAFCRSNLIDEALLILEEMNTHPLCQPNASTYITLIPACIAASRFELIKPLYKQMAERQISPNTATQNIVLSSYGEAGKYDEMEKLVGNMLQSSVCAPDVQTMNVILGVLGRKGEVELMEKWYGKLCDAGVEPDPRTLNLLILVYAKKRMYDKMVSVMEDMRTLCFSWTTSTYNSVIEAFSEVGDAKNLERVFDEMQGEGVRADIKTFCCLIKGYASAGCFDKVVRCVQMAGKLDIPENLSFYNATIGACAMAGNLWVMESVFKRMKERQCAPDSITYSIMEEAYGRQGFHAKVFELKAEKQNLSSKVQIDMTRVSKEECI